MENPNNCRINIDWNNLDNPVKFNYIGEDSTFKVCYKLFRQYFILYALIPFCFFGGLFYYPIVFNPDIWIKLSYLYIFLWGYYIILFIFPILFALLFSKNKKLLKLIPYLEVFNRTKYYAEFKKDDLIDNKLEIPLYSNVFLGYQLEGDFINKIDKLDIIEHPFNIIVRKGKNKKLKRNEYLWKATFIFKDKPMDGSLKVCFH